MQDCGHELNKQLKGVLGRLSQLEDNITNHFVGISTLDIAMLANPFTAGPAAAVAAIYNLVPSGIGVLQGLLDQIGALDPKKLMMQMAASKLEDMVGQLEALAGMVSNMMSTMIEQAEQAAMAAATEAVTAANDAIDALSTIPGEFAGQAAALAASITGGVSAEITLAANTLNAAMQSIGGIPTNILSSINNFTSKNDLAKTAQKKLDDLGNIKVNAADMLKAQADAAKCNSVGLVINS